MMLSWSTRCMLGLIDTLGSSTLHAFCPAAWRPLCSCECPSVSLTRRVKKREPLLALQINSSVLRKDSTQHKILDGQRFPSRALKLFSFPSSPEVRDTTSAGPPPETPLRWPAFRGGCALDVLDFPSLCCILCLLFPCHTLGIGEGDFFLWIFENKPSLLLQMWLGLSLSFRSFDGIICNHPVLCSVILTPLYAFAMSPLPWAQKDPLASKLPFSWVCWVISAKRCMSVFKYVYIHIYMRGKYIHMHVFVHICMYIQVYKHRDIHCTLVFFD